MKEITLSEYLEENTQKSAAKIIGCHRSAISQMLSKGRDIRFVQNSSGRVVRVIEIIDIKKRVKEQVANAA